MKFRYIGTGPTQYMWPSVLAEPGEVYELDLAPDDGNWERAEKPSPAKKSTKED